MTELTIRRVIAARPERVFDAWTRPELLQQWWGPTGVRCIAAEVDLRAGGAYRIANQLPDGRVVWISGEFEIVESPHRLVYSWRIGDEPASRVTVRFAALVPSATEVVIHHERVDSIAARDDHERGWIGCLDGLARWAVTLVTARLRLRPFTLADVPKVFAMSGEAGLRRWIPDQVYRDEAHAEAVVRALVAYTDQAPEPQTRPFVFGVEDAGGLIGHVGLSAARGSVEIGYAIEDARQGHGLATEAVRAVTAWALAELALPEVLGIVAADNVSSRRVLENAGFALADDRAAVVVYRVQR